MIPEIGLTGSIGSGKSTLARLLSERGAVVIDADALAREATAAPDVIARVRETFGEGAAGADGLDRPYLARRVFDDPEARAALEAIVHPRVALLREGRTARVRTRRPPPPLVVHDVPLLFETGLHRMMDAVIVVDAPLDVRVARAASRSGLAEDEIRRRDASQMAPEEKRRRADHVVDNSGEEAALVRRIDELWPLLVAPRRRER